jgi:putative protease
MVKKKKKAVSKKRKVVARKSVKRKTAKKSIKRKTVKKAIKRKPAKKVSRKPAKKVAKKATKKPGLTKQEKADIIGKVTHYFPKVRAAVIKVKVPFSVGATIKIKGHTTDFTQNVSSMQIDRVPINSAKKGDEIGVLVISRVRRNDIVFKA